MICSFDVTIINGQKYIEVENNFVYNEFGYLKKDKHHGTVLVMDLNTCVKKEVD